MLLSQKRLLQILGTLWFIDGLLQLQPRMFTMNLVDNILMPAVQGQPAWIAANLIWIIHIITLHLILVNGGIAAVQIVIGASLLVGSSRWPTSRFVKGMLLFTIAWSIVVWYGGEGMNMLLTGQASILTGAPGAVLFYALLAFVAYPGRRASPLEKVTMPEEPLGMLSRHQLRWYFAAFWLLSALLQLQPFWWQSWQISRTIGGITGQGGLNSIFVDPVVGWLSHITSNAETPLNIILIVLFMGLGVGLLLVKNKQVLPLLILSIAISFIIWWVAEGFGMIFTGIATDFNSGLLLIVVALACWERAQPSMATIRHSPIHPDKQQASSLQKALTPSSVNQTLKNFNAVTSRSLASSSLKVLVPGAEDPLIDGKPAHAQATSRKPRHNRKNVHTGMKNDMHRPRRKANHMRIVTNRSRSKDKRLRMTNSMPRHINKKVLSW